MAERIWKNKRMARPSWAGVGIVAALVIIYVSAYASLFPIFGYAAGVFYTAPVAAAAWFFGARAGLIVGASTFPVNLVLGMAVADRPLLHFVFEGGLLLGSGAEVFVGLMIGYLRDLKVTADAELARRTRAESRLRVVQRQLLNAQETERRSVARELHDDVGQDLTGLKILLQATEDQIPGTRRKAGQLVDTLMEKVRDLSLALRSSMLDDLGLLPALQWQVKRMASESGIRVEFHHFGVNGRLDSETETAAYRIVQEGLTNVARHAKTSAAVLTVNEMETALDITIEDKGVGFDPQALTQRVSSVGLDSMRESAGLLGGHLSVFSVPGQGTTLKVQLPLVADREGRR